MIQCAMSPPLYKYLNVEGARLTLGNRCFKHAKPSTFNDTEDLTIHSLFPEDDETALALIENNFTDILLKHVDEAPTCLNERMRRQITLILAAFKADPDAARLIKEAKKEIPSVFNLERMKQRHRDFVADINTFMQGFRILCVSSRKDSERMWDRYAEGHEISCPTFETMKARPKRRAFLLSIRKSRALRFLGRRLNRSPLYRRFDNFTHVIVTRYAPLRPLGPKADSRSAAKFYHSIISSPPPQADTSNAEIRLCRAIFASRSCARLSQVSAIFASMALWSSFCVPLASFRHSAACSRYSDAFFTFYASTNSSQEYAK
jgi:hypothetical protein